jgi:anti-sigma regulatory factor (Ser/Thr protein kinase)
MSEPHLKHRLASRLEDLVGLARAVSAWCASQGLPDAEAARLCLMLDELVTNTVLHGYAGREDGWVELRLRRQGDVLHVVLSDGAAHFDPTARAPRAATPHDDDVGTRPMGGLGIDFVRRLVQRWEYQALPGGNRLQLWRRIGSTPSGWRA